MTAITQANVGETYQIKWVIPDHKTESIYEAIKIEAGRSITLLHRYLDYIVVRYCGHVYAMSSDVAYRIKV